jgi:hypothetical protein
VSAQSREDVDVVSKYDALADHLRQQRGPWNEMRFSEIERLIGSPLPASSRSYDAWWGNDHSPSHPVASHPYLDCVWEPCVESHDAVKQRVWFRNATLVDE